MGNVKAVSPSDVYTLGKKLQEKNIPDEMVEAVNELIVEEKARNINISIITLKQDSIIARYLYKIGRCADDGDARREAYDAGVLNFESLFEKVGWSVKYDKPGYNEDYPATFTFKPFSGERD